MAHALACESKNRILAKKIDSIPFKASPYDYNQKQIRVHIRRLATDEDAPLVPGFEADSETGFAPDFLEP